MSIFDKNKILVTHDNTFHADDIFACATLSLVLEKEGQEFEVIRTRDEETIKNGDYVFDVGGIYDADKNRFDHHQKGGSGKRENGIEYSSFGLVWKHFGLSLCDNNTSVWKIIDDKMVSPIDAIDNGIDIMTPKFDGVIPYDLEQAFLVYLPTWEEENLDIDQIFKEQAEKVLILLKREIEVAESEVRGTKLILEAYEKSPDKRLVQLEIPFPRYLYQRVLSGLKEPIFLIYPSSHSDVWKVEAIYKSFDTLSSRKLLPESWWGYLGNDPKLKEITGVPDITFCHRNGFLANVKSKEGAIKLAQIALES